ncbi:MAG: hypothetical protein ACKV2T_04930 [Kofleriaceae bacterium]
MYFVATDGRPRSVVNVHRCWALALIAGCGFDVTAGSAVDDGGRSDGSQSDGAIDGAPIDMSTDMNTPSMDQDNDTIVDAQDNCVAIANTNQRNHDGDPFGDSCDRCPHLVSTTDLDGDQDGVGDACDPRPSEGGDVRVLWAGFYEATEINGWSGQGAFTVVDVGGHGYLQQATSNTSGYAPPTNVDRPFVMTEVVIDSVIDVNLSFGLAVNTPTNTQYECSISRTGSNSVVRARINGVAQDTTTWPNTLAAGQRIQFRFDMSNDVDCGVVQGGTTVSALQVADANPLGRTFVGTQGIAVRFDYLFVVDVGP